MVKIPGVTFDFGGDRVRTLAPLSLGALQALQQGLSQLNNQNALDPANMKIVLDVALASLRRNYPEVTPEDVGDLVDVSNMFEVLESAMDVSGVKRRAQEDAAKNLTAQPIPETSTGQGSLPASAPIPVGPGAMSATT